jgi:hypothetical protein
MHDMMVENLGNLLLLVWSDHSLDISSVTGRKGHDSSAYTNNKTHVV